MKHTKKKTEVEEIEEFLIQQGFREVTQKELREMRPGITAREESSSRATGMFSKKVKTTGKRNRLSKKAVKK